MNILVFTTIYPIKETARGFTPIVKYFCEEWVKLGHNVLVISSSTNFPYFYYKLPKFVFEFIENKIGFNLPNTLSKKMMRIIENGVEIRQIPISKNFPGQIINEKKLYENFITLKKEVIDEFNPDIAIGHWINPQIQYLSFVKKSFNITTSLTLHNVPSIKESRLLEKYLPFIDNFGFRSKTIKKQTPTSLNLYKKKQFLCLSGIKDFNGICERKFEKKLINKKKIVIAFVGNMIGRKYPEVILKAVNEIKDIEFEIHYVGEGRMRNVIEKMKTNPNIEIIMHGIISREQVYKVLEESDLLVMLSKNEAFGLVYLEAMLHRVIPIASKYEGFDGIIEDGVNGYLCTAGSVPDLQEKILNIIGEDVESLYKIQNNAYQTAIKMTDKKMAIEYLRNIKNENTK